MHIHRAAATHLMIRVPGPLNNELMSSFRALPVHRNNPPSGQVRYWSNGRILAPCRTMEFLWLCRSSLSILDRRQLAICLVAVSPPGGCMPGPALIELVVRARHCPEWVSRRFAPATLPRSPWLMWAAVGPRQRANAFPDISANEAA